MAIIRRRRPSHPGEVIRGVLPDMGLNPKAFARRLGESRRDVRELLRGARRVTPELAGKLAREVGSSPGLW
ncbi:MAG: HigA family addiction module antitoxin, partial [Acidobacteriota bacterium]|nr:HigA family addiction module antitoxin [Acidobacteriota bacterium]